MLESCSNKLPRIKTPQKEKQSGRKFSQTACEAPPLSQQLFVNRLPKLASTSKKVCSTSNHFCVWQEAIILLLDLKG
jgi:hypothetical protein